LSRSSVDRISRREGMTRLCLGEGKNGTVKHLREEVIGHRLSLLQEFCGKLPEHNLSEGQIHLVFPNHEGNVLCDDNFRRRIFRKLLEKAWLVIDRLSAPS